MAKNERTRNKPDRERYTKAVMKTRSEPTIPTASLGDTTNESFEKNDSPKPRVTRKSKSNRIKIHFKEHWLTYLITIFTGIAGIYLLTINPKIISIEKDIAHINMSLDASEKTLSTFLSKSSDDKAEVLKQIYDIRGDIKSISDRFELYIKIKK